MISGVEGSRMVIHQTRALFTWTPRTLIRIRILENTEKLKPFIIERTIVLSKNGFLNLSTDMTVERDYFIKQKSLCRIDDQGVWHCLLVLRHNRSEGILIMVDDLGIPSFAALYWKKYRTSDRLAYPMNHPGCDRNSITEFRSSELT
jgi:hypothetical protein